MPVTIFTASLIAIPCLDAKSAEKLYMVTLAATAILIVSAPSIILPKKAGIVLKYLGDLSYPLYLSHLTILVLLYLHLGQWLQGHLWLYYVAAVAGAMIVFHCIDARLECITELVRSERNPYQNVQSRH